MHKRRPLISPTNSEPGRALSAGTWLPNVGDLAVNFRTASRKTLTRSPHPNLRSGLSSRQFTVLKLSGTEQTLIVVHV